MKVLSKLLLVSTLMLGRAAANPYAQRYLADAGTSDEFKAAIRRGEVVVGMCPLQAFAAAGNPGPYYVKRDIEKWPDQLTDPVKVVMAQCSYPDKSVIELMFRNASQFDSGSPVVFRVRFVNGKAVLIDQKKFRED
jgi:hypothetical protein